MSLFGHKIVEEKEAMPMMNVVDGVELEEVLMDSTVVKKETRKVVVVSRKRKVPNSHLRKSSSTASI